MREGCRGETIVVTGNTGVDAVLYARARLGHSPIEPPVRSSSGRRLVLLTAHRRESFGEPLRNICEAVRRLVDSYPNVEVVVPVHPNPVVAQTIRGLLAGVARVHLTEPMDYPTFVTMMLEADLILTDSGGIQEEAPALGKPVLVLRERTEREEGTLVGAAQLVGTDPERIVEAALRLLSKGGGGVAMDIYGDGCAAGRIVATLERALYQDAAALGTACGGSPNFAAAAAVPARYS